MDSINEFLEDLPELIANMPMYAKILGGFLFVIAAFGQFVMYEKAGQIGISALIPIWNVITFMKIVGRPVWHMFLLIIPLYNLYLIVKMFIELAQSFGRKSTTDYVFAVILNGLYTLYLAFNESVRYKGPVYGKSEETPVAKEKAMA